MQPAPTHEAWSPPEPTWVPLAPGVKWLLRRPTGDEQAWIAGQVAQSMRRLFEGRAVLEGAGIAAEEMGVAGDLDRLNGLSGVFAGCLYAQKCLQEWQGIEHPTTGEVLEIEPETIRNALLYGQPPWGQPLLAPFLAWLESGQQNLAGDTVRLRQRARDGWSGGFERCRACSDEASDCSKGGSEGGEMCPQRKFAPTSGEGERAWEVAMSPGLWQRAGMEGAVIGLDYRAALLAAEQLGTSDLGAVFRALQAIEVGRLEAEAERRGGATTEG